MQNIFYHIAHKADYFCNNFLKFVKHESPSIQNKKINLQHFPIEIIQKLPKPHINNKSYKPFVFKNDIRLWSLC